MTNQIVIDDLKSKFGEKIIDASESYGMLVVEIPCEENYAVLEYLKNHATFDFNFLTTLAGIHYPENESFPFCVMYQMQSMVNNFRIRIKCNLPKGSMKIKSVVDLFASANWQERQEFDFFGIDFVGHPNLTRILNVEDMDYHPMRKEYRLEDGTRDDKEDKFFGRQ